MATAGPGKQPSFGQKQAEAAVRFFNNAFNASGMYGPAHPTMLYACDSFFSAIKEPLLTYERLTLMVELDALFLEGFQVDRAVNVKRLVVYLKKFGIHSFTFERRISIEETQQFMQLFCNQAVMNRGVETLKAACEAQNIQSIRVNYVMYQKVTMDDAVVKKDAYTLKTEPAQPGVVYDAVVEKPLIKSTDFLSLQEVRAVNQRLHAGGAETGGFPSIEAIMETVLALKARIAQNQRLSEATGSIMALQEELMTEMDILTKDVLIRLIREEYAGGAVSIKRLISIVKRMVPDINELKRLLPALRKGLLADNMPPADYLQLVEGLAHDFKAEDLVTSLTDAAKSFGMSLDDLLKEIK
ncbi:MAG: hypothetical protein PHC61_19035, partial [Chitinivibrionales bacterium]|nr:hypothetical protein [Chitinivibrionales bacterium]